MHTFEARSNHSTPWDGRSASGRFETAVIDDVGVGKLCGGIFETSAHNGF
jgi:hypothetical protein